MYKYKKTPEVDIDIKAMNYNDCSAMFICPTNIEE